MCAGSGFAKGEKYPRKQSESRTFDLLQKPGSDSRRTYAMAL